MTQNKIGKFDEVISKNQKTWDPSSHITEPTRNHAKSIINREQLDDYKEVLWDNKVSSRITLLRHFPYNEESSKNKQTIDRYNDLLRRKLKNEIVDTDELSRLELIVDQMIYSSFDDIPDKKYAEYKNSVKEIFNNPWNTLIIYAETWKKRVKISWDNLREQFKIKEKNDINLKWSNKTSPLWVIYIEMAANLKDELKKIIEENSWKYDNIVIVSNRSYSHWFNIFCWNREVSVKQSEEAFEKTWYNYVDFNSKWEIISKNNSFLQITPENYEEMKKIFINIKHSSIIDFQNKVNALFINNTKLYWELLNESITYNHSIHIFCITNQINSNIKNIEKFLLSKLNLSQQELIEIIKVLRINEEHPIVKKLIIYLWIKAKILGIINMKSSAWISDELEKEIESLKQEYEEINTRSKNNIEDIFSNSLDELVKRGDTLDRKLYYYRKKNNTKLKIIKKEKEKKWDKSELDEIEKYDKKTINFNDIISNKEWSSIFVFLANVWEWKSIELAKMARSLENNNRYIPIFYSSKTINQNQKFNDIKNKINRDINVFKNAFPDKWIVLFFDWIDELNPEIKEEIKILLLNLGIHIKVIIGSRKFEFNEFWRNSIKSNKTIELSTNSHYTSISFDNFDNNTRQNYIKSRLKSLWVKEDELESKISVIDFFLNQSILEEELKNTPLIIYFLCILSKDNEIESIKNRSQLYEKIVLKIIKYHNKSKWDNTSWDYIKHDLNELWEIAFSISKWEEIKISDTKFKKFSILFKKAWSWNYDFIHKSFYEFFLARNLANKINWNYEIYKYRETANKNNKLNEWKNFRPVIMFYSEILENDWKFNELIELLWENWLLKNDDKFGEWFFMWLEILYKILKNNKICKKIKDFKKIYIQIIKRWNKQNNLDKLLNFQEFQKRISFEDNIFVDIYYKAMNIQENDYETKLEYGKLWSNKILKHFLNNHWNYYWLILSWNKKWIDNIYIYWLEELNKWYVNKATYIFKDLAEYWNEYWMECAYNWAMNFLKIWKNSFAYEILSNLNNLWNNKSVEIAFKWAMELFNNFQYKLACKTFIKITKLWNINLSKNIYDCINNIYIYEPKIANEIVLELLGKKIFHIAWFMEKLKNSNIKFNNNN